MPEEKSPTAETTDNSNKRNYMPIRHRAAASLRLRISVTQTAVVCTAFLKDLIEAGAVSPDMSHLTLDKKKVFRAQNQIVREARSIGKTNSDNDVITAVFLTAERTIRRFYIMTRQLIASTIKL